MPSLTFQGLQRLGKRLPPPSTTRVWPVIKPASSEAKNATAYPISSTAPKRFNGIAAVVVSMYACPKSLTPSVSTFPGKTALMVILNRASSRAAVRMNPSIPALVAP